MTAAEDYVIELMSAALRGRKANAKPGDVAWNGVYAIARRHAIEPLLFPALSEEALRGMPPELADRWRHAADMTLYRQLTYDVEREAILADFRKAGVSWLPLKGIMVAGYYPQPGMRSMGDQDIVFGFVEPDGKGGWKPRGDTEDEQAEWLRKADAEVTRVMVARGYEETTNFGREHAFDKAPLHFEMHRSLVSAVEAAHGEVATKEVRYYANPWRLTKPTGAQTGQAGQAGDPSVPGEFRFGMEDEYVFHIGHMSKHYRGSGFGLRFLADEYLYCERFPKAVRSRYVKDQLGHLGLDSFEEAVRRLSVALVDGPSDWRTTVPADCVELFADVLAGGTYGSVERRIARRLALASGEIGADASNAANVTGSGTAARKRDLAKYIWHRLFPPSPIIDGRYAKRSGNPITWLWRDAVRIAKAVKDHPGRLRNELAVLVQIWKRRKQ